MFKFKYFFVALFVAMLAGVVIVSCSDDDNSKDKEKAEMKAKGVDAGSEMCDCVASYEAPVQPQHPASPLPPANFDQSLDYTNPEVLASLDDETIAYLSDPAIMAYFGKLAVFFTEFEAYAGDLYQCLGAVHPYQEYVTANADAYNPNADEPLLSVFTFSNDDFKDGFREGVASCSDAFSALFEAMMMLQ